MRGLERGDPAVRRQVEAMTRQEQWPDWVSGACLLVRRADAEAVGLLDERYFMYTEDVDFCAALRARGRRVLFTPAVEVVHLRGRSAATAPAATRAAYRRSHLAFYQKHHPALGAVPPALPSGCRPRMMSSVRIGIDARKLHDFGIGTYIRNLLRQLARLDHDTEFVLLCRPEDGPALAGARRELPRRVRNGRQLLARRAVRIPLALRREGVTLFHAPHYVLPPLVPCRSVVTIHDCIHLMFPQYLPNRFALALRARRRWRWRRGGRTRVLTVSETLEARHHEVLRHAVGEDRRHLQRLRRALRRRSATRRTVVRVRERFQLHDPFVLYAGNVKPHKNLERLIEAFHLVRAARARSSEAGADRRRDFEVRRAAARRAPASAAPVRAIPRLSAGGDAGDHVSPRRRLRVSRRSTKGSGCRRSRRWPAARRSSRRTCRRCPKSPATRRCSWIRTIREAIADGIRRVLTDAALRAASCGARAWRARGSSRGRRRCGASARSTARLRRTRRGRRRRASAGARPEEPRRGDARQNRARPRLADGHARRREERSKCSANAIPHAELFTLVHIPGSVSPTIERRPIHTSFVQQLPARRAATIATTCRSFPRRSNGFASTASTLVISVSHCCVKSVITPRTTPHLCYCLTPMRYAWDQFDAYFGPERIGRLGSRDDAAGHGAHGPMGPRNGGPRGPLCRYLSLCCGQDRPIL